MTFSAVNNNKNTRKRIRKNKNKFTIIAQSHDRLAVILFENNVFFAGKMQQYYANQWRENINNILNHCHSYIFFLVSRISLGSVYTNVECMNEEAVNIENLFVSTQNKESM